MKHIRSIIGMALIIASSASFADTLEQNLSVHELMPGFFLAVHSYPWPSNSLAALMENGELLLVDTPYTPQATESLLLWLEKRYGKRAIKAINTHFHVDRLGGNYALVKRKIPVYGSDLTVTMIKERGKASLDLISSWVKDEAVKQYYANFSYVPPTSIFKAEEGLILSFGSEAVRVRFPGAGHSLDNLVVYFPKRKVLFGGCLILSMEAKTPGNVSDGDAGQWRMALEAMATKGYDLVIPGHGKTGGVELIDHTITVLGK